MKIRCSSHVVAAVGVCLFAPPCWASYREGFATFAAFYHAVVAVAVSYPIVLILCWLKAFRHTAALLTHVSVVFLGALVIMYVAYQDAGDGFIVVALATLVLFTVAVAPSSIQYLYFRRKRHVANTASVNGPTFSQILASNEAFRSPD